MSTVSADSGGHKKGDVIISLPKELGDRVADYWEKTATCPKKRKRGTNLDCVVQDASSLMQQAGPNGPFRDLVITPNQHLPAIRPGDLLNALNQVIDAGRAIAFLALDNAGVQALAEICFWIAYEKGVEHIPSLVDFVMPEADITATADTPEETGNKDDCPEPEHEPVCSNCGGNDGKDHCKGIPEADNAWAGCPCVDGGYFPYRPYKDAQAFLDAQDALGKLPNGAGGGGDDSTPWCLHGGNPHDNGPAVIPEEYCQCGKDYAELYSTANGGGNGCPYKSAPGPTITLTPWTAQSYDGVTCSYPSTTSCATYNIPNNHPQRDLAVMTAAPDLDKRQGGNCIGSCPQHTDPPVAPVTCECQV